jgi:DNA polymerase-3 subunit delta'
VWDIIGNERAAGALTRALAGATPPHAYLFVGPERVGKATLARRLAQALNCAGAGAPCRECAQCRRIEAGTHADVLTMSVEEVSEGPQRKDISVDQVREIERAAALSPFEGRTRVIIIDPADAMNAAAQNAFLKMLEEPPPNVVFVLVTAREDRLLPTVHSRCRRIEFGLLPAAVIERAILAEGVDAEQARLVARLSGGRPGWALATLRDLGAMGRRREAIESCRAVPRMSVADRLDMAEKLSARFKEERETVLSLLSEWQAWWRDVLLVQSGAGVGAANADMTDALREDAGEYGRGEVTAYVRALREARRRLEGNVQSRLVLDSLVLHAPLPKARLPT